MQVCAARWSDAGSEVSIRTPNRTGADWADIIGRSEDTPPEAILDEGCTTKRIPPRKSLEACHTVSTKWLGEKYDLDVLDAMLAVCAAEKLPAAIPRGFWLSQGPATQRPRFCRRRVGIKRPRRVPLTSLR